MRPFRQHPPLHPRTARSVRGLLLLLVLALVTGATSACAHRGKAGDKAEEEAPIPLPEFVFVSVENHNFSDVVISLIEADGRATRIGTATGSTNSVLRFPGRVLASNPTLQLAARPIGGRTELRSERFKVQPGQQVSWTLETSLQRSSIAIF